MRPMQATNIFLLPFLLLLTTGFQIQGSWTLIEVDSLPVLVQSVNLQIEDFIFRQSSIQQRMTFTGCKSYKYIMEVQNNNLFINYDTFALDNAVQGTCSSGKEVLHTAIQNSLQKAFYFQIFGNFLLVLNPENDNLMRFRRNTESSSRITNIRGVWSLERLNSVPTALTVNIFDTEISLCQDRLSFGYNLQGKYNIVTRLLEDSGCPQENLSQTVLQSKYYRRRGNQISILNENLQEVILLRYVQALDLDSIAQERQLAINEAITIQERNRIAEQQQSTNPTVRLTNSPQDLIGRWQPSNVFGIPLSSTPVFIVFTRNQIVYNGGCNSYIFQYTATEAEITIGQNRSSTDVCQVDDDGLYVSAIARMSQYSVSVASGNQIVLRVNDANGNSIYEMRRTVSQSQNPSQSQVQEGANNTQATQGSSSQDSSGLSITPGRYVFLILARRDLPRKFCTITDRTITYEGCNTLEHRYRITGPNAIAMSGSVIGQDQCLNNNDEIMFNAFNSAAQFVEGEERGSYRFRNSQGVDIINLSLS